MEQNFQTSFIPKKPILKERTSPSRSVSFLTVIGILIFFTMVLATGVLLFYKETKIKSIAKMENNLNLAKNRFEPAKISQLQVLDKRIQAANKILSGHVAISPIFKALQDITMKTVRYTRFSYQLGTERESKVKVMMSGLAVGYRSIALQSDLLAKNKYFIDPIFSNLLLDDQGNVIFDLEFFVNPTFVNYKQMLQTRGEELNMFPVVEPTLPNEPN